MNGSNEENARRDNVRELRRAAEDDITSVLPDITQLVVYLSDSYEARGRQVDIREEATSTIQLVANEDTEHLTDYVDELAEALRDEWETKYSEAATYGRLKSRSRSIIANLLNILSDTIPQTGGNPFVTADWVDRLVAIDRSDVGDGNAMWCLGHVAVDKPVLVAPTFNYIHQIAAEEPPGLRLNGALYCLEKLAGEAEHAQLVVRAVDTLITILQSATAENPTYTSTNRVGVADTLERLSKREPESLFPFLPDLIKVVGPLDDESAAETISSLLGTLARERPSSFVDHVSTIHSMVDESDPAVQSNLLVIPEMLVEEDSEVVEPFLDDLNQYLAADAVSVQEAAMDIVRNSPKSLSGRLEPVVETILEQSIDTTDIEGSRYALSTLAQLAEKMPQAIDPHLPVLKGYYDEIENDFATKLFSEIIFQVELFTEDIEPLQPKEEASINEDQSLIRASKQLDQSTLETMGVVEDVDIDDLFEGLEGDKKSQKIAANLLGDFAIAAPEQVSGDAQRILKHLDTASPAISGLCCALSELIKHGLVDDDTLHNIPDRLNLPAEDVTLEEASAVWLLLNSLCQEYPDVGQAIGDVHFGTFRTWLQTGDNLTRCHALNILADVAVLNDTQTERYVEAIIECCDDNSAYVRGITAENLQIVGQSEVESLYPYVDEIVGLLDDVDGGARYHATITLQYLCEDSPTLLSAHLDAVARRLQDADTKTRSSALQVLLAYAPNADNRVPYLDAVGDRLYDADPDIQAEAVKVLAAHSLEGHSDQVLPFVERTAELIPNLEHEQRLWALITLFSAAIEKPSAMAHKLNVDLIVEVYRDTDASFPNEEPVKMDEALADIAGRLLKLTTECGDPELPQAIVDDIKNDNASFNDISPESSLGEVLPSNHQQDGTSAEGSSAESKQDDRDNEMVDDDPLDDVSIDKLPYYLPEDTVVPVAGQSQADIETEDSYRFDIPELIRHLSGSKSEYTSDILAALLVISDTRPSDLTPYLDELLHFLETEPSNEKVGARTAVVVSRLIADKPESVGENIEQLGTYFDHPAAIVRTNVAEAVARVAAVTPSDVEPTVPAISECIHRSDDVACSYALVALGRMGQYDTDHLATHVDAIVAGLETPTAREVAATAFADAAQNCPKKLAEEVTDPISVPTSPRDFERTAICNFIEGLTTLAETHPVAVVNQVDTLTKLLKAPYEMEIRVERMAMKCIYHAAKRDPSTVTTHDATLREFVNHSDTTIQRRSLATIGVMTEAGLVVSSKTVQSVIEIAQKADADIEKVAVKILEDLSFTDAGEINTTGVGVLSEHTTEIAKALSEVDSSRQFDLLNILSVIGDQAPVQVRPHYQAIAARFDHENPAVRDAAFIAGGVIVEDNDEWPVDHVGDITQYLSDDRPEVNILYGLNLVKAVARTTPVALVPHFDCLESLLASEHASVREEGSRAIGLAARATVQMTDQEKKQKIIDGFNTGLVAKLLDLIPDFPKDQQTTTAAAIATLSRADIECVSPLSEQIIEIASITSDNRTRGVLFFILRNIAEESPNSLTSCVRQLVSLAEEESHSSDRNIEMILEYLSRAEPDAVTPYLDRITSLSDGEPLQTTAVAGILRFLAESHPDAVGQYTSELTTWAQASDENKAKYASIALSDLVKAGKTPSSSHWQSILEALDGPNPEPNLIITELVGYLHMNEGLSLNSKAISALSQPTESRELCARRTNLLFKISKSKPELLTEHASAIQRRVTDEEPTISASALDLLSRLPHRATVGNSHVP
ncbi:HEAT repeat domain-containing protein [Haloarcula sp. AONF1]